MQKEDVQIDVGELSVLLRNKLRSKHKKLIVCFTFLRKMEPIDLSLNRGVANAHAKSNLGVRESQYLSI